MHLGVASGGNILIVAKEGQFPFLSICQLRTVQGRGRGVSPRETSSTGLSDTRASHEPRHESERGGRQLMGNAHSSQIPCLGLESYMQLRHFYGILSTELLVMPLHLAPVESAVGV